MSDLGSAVGADVASRQARLANGDPRARAELASLRRGAGRSVEDDLPAWRLVSDVVPERFQGRDGATCAERAAFAAMTLHALAQQSVSTGMHAMGVNAGEAFGRLSSRHRSEALERRFASLVTAASQEEAVRHLRSLVTMLRTERIGMDYGALADDLAWWDNARHRARVRTRWTRSFASSIKSTANSDQEVPA